MKRPAFQFYPADWRNDPALKLCSVAARGLWIDMICIMHMAEPYGYLCAAGRTLDIKDLSKLIGESERNVRKLFDELQRNEVFSKTEEGVIFSRRMVRDEDLREVRASGGNGGKEYGFLGAEHGSKGGRPKKVTGDKNPPSIPPLNPPPSSSSSSSSSNTPLPPDGGDDAFARFWETYPKKVAKPAALKAFKKAKLNGHFEGVLQAIERQKTSEQWLKNGGEFIPNPATFLNNQRWLDELPPLPVKEVIG